MRFTSWTNSLPSRFKMGASLRCAQFSPRGTNASFVQVLNDHSIRVRTYERCGRRNASLRHGVTAAALITAQCSIILRR